MTRKWAVAWNLFFYIDYFLYFVFYRWFFVPYLNNQSQRFSIMNAYWEKKFIREVLLASAIVVIPFCLYLHTLFADNQDYLTLFGFTLNHNRGTSALYVYSVLVPLINLLLASVWFFTNRFWWRKFILIPVGLFLYQLAKIHLYFDGVYGNTDFIIAIMITSLCLFVIYNIAILINKKGVNARGKINYSTSVTRYDFNRLKMIYSNLKNQINKVNENKLGRPQLSLLQNLYHLKLIFEKTLNYNLKSPETARRIPDYAIVFLLLLLPIVAYSFKIVPDGVQILTFGNITLTNNGFIDVGYFIWFCALKFCSILPLIIWFVTSSAWWRYALFSPIIMFSYQLYAAIVKLSPY